MKTVQIKLTVPVRFNELLTTTAKLKDISVEEFIIEELISGLDCALQDPMGHAAGMSMNYCHDYCEQVRDLAYPERARV